ncbi:unnamed protein product [Arctia plantaginis]|uniref:Uncharacterized protein n=1 Tax=Arctia plantaginis TaxID=874455 RepID=A0A8S0ZP81_ARCPL|nr:unnamed protein product [Arctia plantaginis]CAB3236170.1 unnamed protein product [Arctia plantaginis]
MPASNIDSYLQDARDNFDAVRPAPIYSDNHRSIVRCDNVHVSTNCYYGYHGLKSTGDNHVDTDYEMADVGAEAVQQKTSSKSKNLSKKRCADDQDYPQTKRLRDEGMVPSTSNFNPCLLRPTHNNPDISRCLMVHMI